MDPAFQKALVPNDHVCLGKRLLPLTLGHWFLLAEHAPHFLDRDLRISDGNLPAAVLICSLPLKRARKVFREAGPMRRFLLELRLLWWGRQCRALDFTREAVAFLNYLRDSFSSPRLNISPDKLGHAAQAPEGFWILSFLMADFGFAREEAMAMPLTLALCLRAAHAESLGQVELQSASSRALWRAVRAQHRPKPAETEPETSRN